MSPRPLTNAGRLREIRYLSPDSASGYPFSIPALAGLRSLAVGDVTFFVGDNGTGKSTLIEAVAIRAGLNPEGGSRDLLLKSRSTASQLHTAIELAWERQPPRAFFLRAETFYNTATAYAEVGVGGYHDQSHGESFLDAMTRQVSPGSFIVMDEPESALSVMGQLKLMRAVHDLVATGSQLLIATHSPILLAYPGALIYQFSESGIVAIDFEDAAAVQLTKAFLESPGQFLRHLFAD